MLALGSGGIAAISKRENWAHNFTIKGRKWVQTLTDNSPRTKLLSRVSPADKR